MKKSTYKVHSWEEINAISTEEEYEELRQKAISAAEELDIPNPDTMDLIELETRIKLRNTPLSKIGHKLDVFDKNELKPILNLWAKLRKFKEEVIHTLSYYSDGYVKIQKTIIGYDIDGEPVYIRGLIVPTYHEGERGPLTCYLKEKGENTSTYAGYDIGGPYSILASDLSLNTLIQLVNVIEDGEATIFSKEEFVEFLDRNQDYYDSLYS